MPDQYPDMMQAAPPPNKPLGPVPKQGFGLNNSFMQSALPPPAPGSPAQGPAPLTNTPLQPLPVPSILAQGAAPGSPAQNSPTPTPPTNFNIQDLVAPTRSPLAQAARDEQKRVNTMSAAGVTGLGPQPQQKQMFENQQYKDDRHESERGQRQMIKQQMRRHDSGY